MSQDLHALAVAWLLALVALALAGLLSSPASPLVLVVCFDLFFLALSCLLVLLSAVLDDQLGQQFVYLLLAVVASEAALGLSALVSYRRGGGSAALESIGGLKG